VSLPNPSGGGPEQLQQGVLRVVILQTCELGSETLEVARQGTIQVVAEILDKSAVVSFGASSGLRCDTLASYTVVNGHHIGNLSSH
jgi:hypothetical protein